MTYLTPKELCERLKVSYPTIVRWRKKKIGPPFVKVNYNTVRYPLDKLESWEENQQDL